jgi:regulation of enolase protein 1 (concanavalin A-like superfamily)
MAIVFSCDCGKQFRAQEKHAGRQMRCRRCGAVVTIPRLSTAEDIEDVTETQPSAPTAGPESDIVVSLETPAEEQPRDPFEIDWLSRLEAMTREQAEQMIEAPPESAPGEPAGRAGSTPLPASPLEVLPADETRVPPPVRQAVNHRGYNPLLDGTGRTSHTPGNVRTVAPPVPTEQPGQPQLPQRRYNPLLDESRPEDEATDTAIMSAAPPVTAASRRFPPAWAIAAFTAGALLLLAAGGAYLWVALNQSSATDIGAPAVKGSATRIDDQSYDMVAGGKGMWAEADQLHFCGKRVSGDFDVQVRVTFVSGPGTSAKAGLMARESLDAPSRNVAMLATPSETGPWMQVRRTAAGSTFNFKGKDLVASQGIWVRLTRAGNEFTASSSVDGKTWNPAGKEALDLPSRLYVGMAASAGDEETSAHVQFRGFAYR